MLRGLLGVLFPAECLGCGRSGRPFCSRCWATVALLSPPGCERCGRPLDGSVRGCADCPPGDVSWCRSPFLYDGPVRRALMRLKFGGSRSLAEGLAPFMAGALSPGGGWSPGPLEGAVLTWVPLGPKRKRSRGFDQAEVLARALGPLAGLPVRRLLRRRVETAPQARRAGPERRLALAGAFEPVGEPPPLVVLVDDVLTSGATVAECAGRLLRAGASEVGTVTAARALGSPLPPRCYNPHGLPLGSVVARERSSR